MRITQYFEASIPFNLTRLFDVMCVDKGIRILLKLIVAFSTLEFNFPALFVLRIGWQRNEGQQEPRVTLPVKKTIAKIRQ